jgi:hypothetical protein
LIVPSFNREEPKVKVFLERRHLPVNKMMTDVRNNIDYDGKTIAVLSYLFPEGYISSVKNKNNRKDDVTAGFAKD